MNSAQGGKVGDSQQTFTNDKVLTLTRLLPSIYYIYFLNIYFDFVGQENMFSSKAFNTFDCDVSVLVLKCVFVTNE